MDVVNLLMELVGLNTVNSPDAGIKPSDELPKYVRDLLDDWGIASEIMEEEGYHSIFGMLGEGEPILMYLAHYDTVPVSPEEWDVDPFKLTMRNGRAYGRGALDDKSNVASMLMALKKIRGRRLRGTLIFSFTGDEETGGLRGAKVIRDKLIGMGLMPKFLVNGDGPGLSLIIRRRGAFSVSIRVPGRRSSIRGYIEEAEYSLRTLLIDTRHAAYFIPGVDTHPMLALSLFLNENPEYHVVKLEGGFLKSNVMPGSVKATLVKPGNGELVEADGGLTDLIATLLPLSRISIPFKLYSDYGVNVTPNVYKYDAGSDVHEVVMDLRAIANMEEVRGAIVGVLSERLPYASYEIREDGGYLHTPKDSAIVRLASSVLREIGVDPALVEGKGASDSRYFSPMGVECIDIGPEGGGMHGPNEYVCTKSLNVLVEFYERLALKILG